MKILVVCLGNVNRSPIAEAMLREAGVTDVRSRGLKVTGNLRASAKARSYAEQLGLPLTEHRSQLLQVADLKWADTVLVMNMRHAARIEFLMPKVRNKIINLAIYDKNPNALSIPDPGFMKTGSEEIRAAFDMLTSCVTQFIKHQRKEGAL